MRAQRQPDQSWFLHLQVHEGVQLIPVTDTLPRAWRCFTEEREVIIGPGARYTLYAKMDMGEVHHLYVKVNPMGAIKRDRDA